MTDQPRPDSLRPSDVEILTLLGRIDERTKNLAQDAIDSRTAIIALSQDVSNLDAKFATRREMNLAKWMIGVGMTVLGLIVAFVYQAVQRGGP